MFQKREPKLNAYKHGLTGRNLIIDDDERENYQAHCQAYIDLYNPVGHPEQVLVRNIADDYWRSMRGRDIEFNLLTHAFQPEGDEDRKLSNISLYLNRIERSIKTNTKALEDMQSKRRETRIRAEEEVKLLARAASAKGQSYDPAADFPPDSQFVFSKSQVLEMISREDRLIAARSQVKVMKAA